MKFMKFRYKFLAKKSVSEVFRKHLSPEEDEESELGEIYFLVDLIQIFRPEKVKAVEFVSIRELNEFLANNPAERTAFTEYLSKVLNGRDFRSILTESGILQNKNFTRELRKRIFAKLIPYQPKENTLEYLLAQVFYLHSDIQWISKIEMAELEELFRLLELQPIYQPAQSNLVFKEIFEALNLISQRISGRALEAEVIQMLPEF